MASGIRSETFSNDIKQILTTFCEGREGGGGRGWGRVDGDEWGFGETREARHEVTKLHARDVLGWRFVPQIQQDMGQCEYGDGIRDG